jgi:uncharacterized membrane protein YkoI
MKIKNLILPLFFLVGGTAIANAQDLSKNEVPQAVKTVFNKQYPKAYDIEWERKGDNYEASFDLSRVDYKAVYTPTGNVVFFEKDITTGALPKIIIKNIKVKYPNYRIDDAKMINTKGVITYKVDLDGKPDLDVWYTPTGKFIKEITD